VTFIAVTTKGHILVKTLLNIIPLPTIRTFALQFPNRQFFTVVDLRTVWESLLCDSVHVSNRALLRFTSDYYLAVLNTRTEVLTDHKPEKLITEFNEYTNSTFA